MILNLKTDNLGRSKKSFRNIFTGIVNKIVIMLLSFATRTIFIRLLGAEYTGINSLYSNILSVLSLAELGIGNVLMFYLYSALKEKNEKRINSLVFEFRKIYFIIIVVVLFFGLILVPFLPFIVNTSLNTRELITYYLLYITNSAASYFVVYRTMVLSADQNNYISNICNTFTTFIMYILQIGYLLLFKEFIGYLVIQVICTFANNIILNYITCKKYPYLKTLKSEKNKNFLDIRVLLGNIKATFLYKLSDTIISSSTSIIISVFFGAISVGYYTNYYSIIAYLISFAGIFANGMVASFGNLNAEGNNLTTYKIFRASMLLFSICGAFGSSCYLIVIQDFIPIWIGSEYLMSESLALVLAINFYYVMATNSVWMLRFSMGLFKEAQYSNIIAATLNIIFSLLLGYYWGISGVVIASVIARLITTFWYEGKVVFNKFNKPLKIYLFIQLKYFITTFFIILISYMFSSLLSFKGIYTIFIKIFFCFITTFIIEIIINVRTEEFRILISKVKNVIK